MNGSVSIRAVSIRAGFTLIEMLTAISITPTLSLALGALVYAVQTARAHTQGLQEAVFQADAVMERIRYMVDEAGTYRTGGGETQLGLAVVTRDHSGTSTPEILVVWSGGRTGGMAGQGEQDRLPTVDELLIYAPDSLTPANLVEAHAATDSSSIDFSAAEFPQRIRSLLTAASTEKISLTDRLHTVSVSASSTADPVGCLRFALHSTPSDAELNGVSAGSNAWHQLPWPQNLATSASGMRQAEVAIEMQLDSRESAEVMVAIPFFGSARRRYVYHP